MSGKVYRQREMSLSRLDCWRVTTAERPKVRVHEAARTCVRQVRCRKIYRCCRRLPIGDKDAQRTVLTGCSLVYVRQVCTQSSFEHIRHSHMLENICPVKKGEWRKMGIA